MQFPLLTRGLLLLSAAVLTACTSVTTPSNTAAKTRGSDGGFATKPDRSISTKASRYMYVRTTAYHHTEPGGLP